MIAPKLTENIVLDLISSADEFPVDFDLAWKWLEFTNKRNAKRSLIECEFVEGEDFRVLLPNEQNSIMSSKISIRGRKEGRKSESLWLTIECFKSWGMMAATKKGKEVRKYFLDCERKLKQIQQNALQPEKKLYLSDLLENDLGATVLQGYAKVYEDVAKEFGDVATIADVPNYADIAKCLFWASHFEMSEPPEFDDDLEESTPEVDLDNQRFALMVREAFATLDPVGAANWIIDLAKKDPESIYLTNFPRSQNIPGYQRGSAELAAAKN